MRLRVGMIGAGRVAAQHERALVASGAATVVAVADPRADAAAALAGRHDAAVHDDHAALLARDDLDVVVIAVPHDRHAEVVLPALASGRHVYMDKPLAATLEDAHRVCEAAEAAAGAFMLCHNLLFHPVVQRAAALVDAGIAGRRTTASAWSHGWLDLAPDDFRRSAAATGGGAWLDAGSHLVYVLERLAGPVEELRVLGARGESRLEGEDNAAGVARFADGSLATLRVSYADRAPGHDAGWPGGWTAGYEVRGTDGFVRAEVAPVARLVAYDGTRELQVEEPGCDFGASFDGAMAAFLAALRAGAPPPVSAQDGLRVLSLVHDAIAAEAHA